MVIWLKSTSRPIALVVILSLVFELIAPCLAWALTSGPIQPEFSSFEPVATTNMVSDFTGGFTYNLPVLNIPGPNGSGYGLSLSYHSGASAEEDASWVGYGWTLNPGSIVRNKRGLPDDYKGQKIRYWNKVKDNWTITVGFHAGTEVFSHKLGINADATVRYNNYRGFGSSFGIGLSFMGIVDVGYTVASDAEGTFKYSINPTKLLSAIPGNDNEGADKAKVSDESHDGMMNKIGAKLQGMALQGAMSTFDQNINAFLNNTFGESVMPTNVTPYTGSTWKFSVGLQGDLLPIQAGINGEINGSYSIQKNIYKSDQAGYGYMYSGSAGSKDVMDYYTEKDSPYDNRDLFLSIPFSNADNYNVTGEGLSGGFRLYNRKAGHFHLAEKRSRTNIIQVSGGEIHLGLDVGLGAGLGIGSHSLEVKNWDAGERNTAFKFAREGEIDESCFFRFNNDLGGTVDFSENDDPETAEINIISNNHYPNLAGKHFLSSLNDGKRSGRSSYIGYSTNDEMNAIAHAGCKPENWESSVHYNAYTKDDSTRKWVDRNDNVKTGVGEFAITKSDGSMYVYGIPVYARNEKTLQYGLEGINQDDIRNYYLAYKHFTLNENDENLSVVGQEMNDPYASTYLVTEIRTPDYIDRTNDGPTSDDLGGYTRFKYLRTAGTPDKGATSESWYKWRSPYSGMLYNRNSFSDGQDDMGAVSSGEKEIYYLDTIETKTHFAAFVLADDREDGFEANHSETEATGDDDPILTTPINSKLRRLDRIELWSKDASGNKSKLLSTVRFAYDYSSWPGLPNSIIPEGESLRQGKLTLTRVWFEYQGAVNAKTSPYLFGYEYKKSTDYASTLNGVSVTSGTHLDSILTYGDRWIGPTGHEHDYENPAYSPFDIDRWGNYQYDGQARFDVFNSWVNQQPAAAFDPAAWQLKWIKLPSGGEIHVQYEQNEYRYVQQEPVMAMVNLRPATGIDYMKTETTTSDDKYYLDLASLGITDATDLLRVKAILQKRYLKESSVESNGAKIFFKFLYGLDAGTPDFGNCTTEYMTGYVNVSNVGKDANGVFVVLGGGSSYSRPFNVCVDYYNKNRSGNMDPYGACGGKRMGMTNKSNDPAKLVRQLYGSYNNPFLDPSSFHLLDLHNSYLRIPLLGAKKGGGIRVKRLMMYDKGIETGDAALYGSEYIYQTETGECSGVATNEPSQGREENPLIDYIGKRTDQTWFQKVISGPDRNQFEGPIGESILPGPSIGYSRVVVTTIRPGKTQAGYSVNEFYTARDYPFDLQYSSDPQMKSLGTAKTSIFEPDPQWGILSLPGYSYSVQNMFRTQGFRFILNNMHGQPKRMSSYSGQMSDKAGAVQEQIFEYYKPGESVPLMTSPDATDMVEGHPGKETEVVFESRSVEDITKDNHVEVDGTVGLFFIPIPLVGAFPNVDYGEAILKTHVNSKVIRYPAIQKRVTVTRDGVTQVTENIGFNPDTGEPILMHRTDGYHGLTLEQSSGVQDGSYYSYTAPAPQSYPAMGQKAQVERTLLKSGDDYVIEKWYADDNHHLNFRFIKPGISEQTLALFSPGDMIQVFGYEGQNETYLGLYNVGHVAGNRIELFAPYPACSYVTTELMVDRVNVRFIRSGRTNQLNASVGNITTYGRLPEVNDHPLY